MPYYLGASHRACYRDTFVILAFGPYDQNISLAAHARAERDQGFLTATDQDVIRMN